MVLPSPCRAPAAPSALPRLSANPVHREPRATCLLHRIRLRPDGPIREKKYHVITQDVRTLVRPALPPAVCRRPVMNKTLLMAALLLALGAGGGYWAASHLPGDGASAEKTPLY